MSTPYRQGYDIEMRVVEQLRAAKWHASRTPGSRGPYDVIAIRPGPRIVLVQVKGNAAIDRTQWNSLLRLAQMLDATPVWAWKDEKGRLHYLRMLRPRAAYQRSGSDTAEAWTDTEPAKAADE